MGFKRRVEISRAVCCVHVMFSDKRMNSIIFLVIQNHNGAGRCAAERRCVAKFLAAEGVYSFEIH